MPDPAAQGAEERREWRIWPTHTDGTPEPVVCGPPITESLLVVPKSEHLALAARLEAVEGALRPFVRGLDHRNCETLDGEVAPYVTPAEADAARAALNPEQGVTQADLDRGEELIREGIIPDEPNPERGGEK